MGVRSGEIDGQGFQSSLPGREIAHQINQNHWHTEAKSNFHSRFEQENISATCQSREFDLQCFQKEILRSRAFNIVSSCESVRDFILTDG